MKVRIYGYRGVQQIGRINPRQHSYDSLMVLYEPYEWAVAVDTNGATPVAMTPQSPDNATVIRIEVPDSEAIRYEINPPGRSTVASVNSPKLQGKDYFHWGAGWTVSIIDASAVTA